MGEGVGVAVGRDVAVRVGGSGVAVARGVALGTEAASRAETSAPRTISPAAITLASRNNAAVTNRNREEEDIRHQLRYQGVVEVEPGLVLSSVVPLIVNR